MAECAAGFSFVVGKYFSITRSMFHRIQVGLTTLDAKRLNMLSY